MNWSKGFTARYYAAIVDPRTWRDLQTFDISGGSIKLADNTLRESADLQTKAFDHDDEYWVRVYMEARQQGEQSAKMALFTGLASSPNRQYNGIRQTSNITCYSVLKPAEDILMPLGWNAPAGSNGARLVYELLKPIISAPISIAGVSPAVDVAIVAESGETRLSLIDYILDVIGWRLRIAGDGSVTICAQDQVNENTVTMDADKYDIIEMQVDIENNWFDCPNVFRAVNDDMMAIARDEDPNSRLSIQRRGREIWAEELSCTLNDKESIGEYAKRRLKELQTVGYTLSYNRRFHPDIRPSDMIWIRYPRQGIAGAFEVTSQTINLEHGAPVSEEAFGVEGGIF